MPDSLSGSLPTDRKWVDRYYDPDEADFLWQLVETLRPLDADQRVKYGRSALRELWSHDLTYIEKTCWIRTKDGVPALIKLNPAQRRLWKDCIEPARKAGKPLRVIILKARQLGFSTFIQLFHSTMSALYPNRNSCTVSYDEGSTHNLLDKASYAHQNLWFPLPLRYESKGRIEYRKPHASSFYALTAGNANLGRSYTFQHVHCSEIPFWRDAETTLAGLEQSIPKSPETTVFWESTAQGMTGPFYEGWKAAEEGVGEFQPFFAPWYWDPEYAVDFPSEAARQQFMKKLSPPDRKYKEAYGLSLEQMAWRQRKIDEPAMNHQVFRQEFPASAEEAFLMSGYPVFDGETLLEMARNCRPPIAEGEVVLKADLDGVKS